MSAEDEPVLHMNLSDGREIDATRDNTSLFTFMGHLAIYNHVFVVTQPEENIGVYMFRTGEQFDDLEEYLVANDYPAHINLREVAECDVNAYNNMIEQNSSDLDAGIPEDWA